MTFQPPKEGARWGEDPETPAPKVSALQLLELQLRSDFGEENLQSALKLAATIKTNFPHLAITRSEPLEFAAELLVYARRAVSHAGLDGRVHTMPETLAQMDKGLGQILSNDPSQLTLAGIEHLYGDEHLGRQAKEARRISLLPPPPRTGDAAGFLALKPLRHWLDFKGRSRRSELLQFLPVFLAPFLLSLLLWRTGNQAIAIIVQAAAVLLLIPPLVSLLVRRMHDIGITGWFMAFFFFWLPIIIALVGRGTFGPNKYGPDPKGAPLNEEPDSSAG